MFATFALATLLSSQATAPSGLHDPRPSARLDALRAIDAAGARQQTVAVAALAADADDQVQLTAIDTLLNLLLPQRIAARRRVALVVEVRGLAGPAGAYLAGILPVHPVAAAIFEPLARALGDLHPQVRSNAAYAIAICATADPSLIPARTRDAIAVALTPMVAAADATLRLAGVRAAGRVFRALASEPIDRVRGAAAPLSDGVIAMMNQPDEEAVAAIEAVGLMREVRGLQAVTDRFLYYREEGRQLLALTSLEALARIAHPSSADVVRALVTDKWAARNDDVALTVAFARERILHDGSIAAIRAAAQQPRTKARAESYLFELTGK